ncbi:hypothetical protein GCM10010232_43470 [Streptomyces amakusaensis]
METLANSIGIRFLSRPQEAGDRGMRNAMAGCQQQGGEELERSRIQCDLTPLPQHDDRTQYTKFHIHQLHVIFAAASRDRLCR